MSEQDLDTLCLLAGVFFPPIAPEPADSEDIAAYKKLDGQELRSAVRAVCLSHCRSTCGTWNTMNHLICSQSAGFANLQHHFATTCSL